MANKKPAGRSSVIRVVTGAARRAITRRTSGNSGMSGQAGRTISGRQRQVDEAVDRISRGMSGDSRRR